jgi:hypothetical protein
MPSRTNWTARVARRTPSTRVRTLEQISPKRWFIRGEEGGEQGEQQDRECTATNTAGSVALRLPLLAGDGCDHERPPLAAGWQAGTRSWQCS